MASLSAILAWFKTGLIPTQGQFVQAWSSFWHKEESIPQTSIFGLQLALSNITSALQPVDSITLTDNGNYVIPAGKMVVLLVVESSSGQLLNIGTSEEATDILEEAEIPPLTPYAIRLDIVADKQHSKTIYLHGFAEEIKIHIHKINYQ